MEQGIKIMTEQHLLSSLGARHLQVVFGYEFIPSPRQFYYLYFSQENVRQPRKAKECVQGHRPANGWSQDPTSLCPLPFPTGTVQHLLCAEPGTGPWKQALQRVPVPTAA